MKNKLFGFGGWRRGGVLQPIYKLRAQYWTRKWPLGITTNCSKWPLGVPLAGILCSKHQVSLAGCESWNRTRSDVERTSASLINNEDMKRNRSLKPNTEAHSAKRSPRGRAEAWDTSTKSILVRYFSPSLDSARVCLDLPYLIHPPPASLDGGQEGTGGAVGLCGSTSYHLLYIGTYLTAHHDFSEKTALSSKHKLHFIYIMW